MIGYDFDKTIYKRDSSTDFFKYMVFSRPYLLIFTPWFLIVFMLFVLIFVSFSSEKTIVEDRQYPAFVRPEIIKQAGLSSQIDGQPSNNVLQKTQSVLAKQPDKSLDILRQWLNESVSEDNV